ncbi:PTS sugar transporter subunit IIA [Nannocystis sp. ILAH1]|uniref:helix-turn-helix domain-containing protein n=1 Tax=unclassified Nannocystis TaxID=2627009 RepID=UPI0022703441|nr:MULTISPECIES: PTS sugar transporter subunit IIA [unclassified Nannocystis]MCY0988871.1 PTS sugar transporter subunit IIA [Nannocystis sp. ILAH1]MCY1072703.1 PTS sugar transporter subunit IIA [Nannocystis sp. RBIL2]
MHFGATLRLLRVDAGVSLRALAQKIGVSSAYLSRVENGHDQAPTPDRLMAIARALDLPPTLLIDLAQRVSPFVARYLEDVPSASYLFLEIARRKLNAAQLARVQAFLDAEFPLRGAAAGRITPRLHELLTPERVLLKLSCSYLGDAIDIAAVRLASAAPGLNAAAIAAEIRERERESPTGIGHGVAVPHAMNASVQPVAALVTLARPLPVATPDDIPLQMLLVIVGGGQAPLELLARAARLATPDTVADLCQATTPEAALGRVRHAESELG